MKAQTYYFNNVELMALLYKSRCTKPADGVIEYPQPTGFPKENFVNLSKTPSLNKNCAVTYITQGIGQNHYTNVGYYKLINNPLFSSHSEPDHKYFVYKFNEKLNHYTPDSQGFIVYGKPPIDKLAIDSDTVNDVDPSIQEGFIMSIYVDTKRNLVVGVPYLMYYIPQFQRL